MSNVGTKKRRPVKRYIILALFAIGAYAAFFGPTLLRPVRPVVVVPPEPTGLTIAGFPITNTILATLITDVLLLLLAFSAWRFSKRGSLIPSGIYNAFEGIVEFLWNSVEGVVGKWAKRVFPIVATIFLLIFVANMVKMVPGFESLGYLKEVHKAPGYAPVKLFSLGTLDVYSIDRGQEVTPVHAEEAVSPEGESISHTEEGTTKELCTACEVVPFLRGSATDLNFPLALAVTTVILTQVYGVWSLGPFYFGKFFQFKQLVSGGVFGLINFGVGFLEFILEFFKILSFSFRLFGNIFAGALLLSILGALTAVAVPPLLYLFEVFFGIIQAYVFFLLATNFIGMALVSHHGGEEKH